MLDFVASVDASNNATGQSGLSGIAQKLSGAGLLELHIGSSGLSANLGSGGIDVAGNLYRFGKGMVDKSIIEAYMAQDATKGAIALNAYAYGDWNAETTARRLGTGKDELTLLGKDDPTIAKDAKAQTIQNNDGSGRQIYIRDAGDGEGDILNMAVTLQHEAYRDGMVGPENEAETYAAALAHTKMAIGMLNDGKKGFLDADLAGDIMAFRNGTFEQHVATSYDSSADYWRLKSVKNKDGQVTGYEVQWDNSLALTIENSDGTSTNIDPTQINTTGNLGIIQQWFTKNGIANQWNDNSSSFFSMLGDVSKKTMDMEASVRSGSSVGASISNFRESIQSLLASSIKVSGFVVPNQDINYALMPGSISRTTLYGNRLVTPELADAGVRGSLFDWATYPHDAEDYSGGGAYITPMESQVGISYDASFGLRLTLDFGEGNSLQSNHADPSSAMNLLQAMLMSNSVNNLVAGVRFGTMGTTGTSTDIHNHLIARLAGNVVAPSLFFGALNIPQAFSTNPYDVLLTGFSANTPYNDPKLLKQILDYSSINPGFNKQAYVDSHPDCFKPYWDGGYYYEFFASTMSYNPTKAKHGYPIP